MAIKMQKVALLEVFHHTAKTKFIQKLADMFDRFTELYLYKIVGMRILRHDQISQKSSLQNFTFDFVPVSY